MCNPGFSVIGLECVCQGLRVGSYCDRCYNKQFHQPQSSKQHLQCCYIFR
jgi:hypothetical protein